MAEGLVDPMIDIANALKRRAAYERRTAYSRASANHPVRTEFVIRGVHAITMDPHIGHLTCTDIHVRDGEIVNLGRNLAIDAPEIDGSGLIALPGFIASHRHLATEAIAPLLPALLDLKTAEPQDVYRVLRVPLLDLLHAGFTTVLHCAIDIGSEHAETAVLAQIDAGLRGRYSFPMLPDDEVRTHDPQRTLQELRATWFTERGEHLLELGIAGDPSTRMEEIAEAQMLPYLKAHSVALDGREDPASLTIGAARQIGMDQWIGSLSPGKRADLILVAGVAPERNGDCPNIVTAENVDMVCIDGRIRKRNGILVEPNEGLIRQEGAEAIARMQSLIGRSSAGSPSRANAAIAPLID